MTPDIEARIAFEIDRFAREGIACIPNGSGEEYFVTSAVYEAMGYPDDRYYIVEDDADYVVRSIRRRIGEEG